MLAVRRAVPALWALFLALAAVPVPAAPVAAGCAPQPGKAAFAYDPAASLKLTQGAPFAPVPGVEQRELAFASGTRTVAATIVRPGLPGGARPGILWVHWLGDPETTNRTEFLSEARALATRGVTSLLVDAMWAAPDWFAKLRAPATDACASVAQVVALRRALDVLSALPDVDPGRLAYVGHDFGAMYGALLMAVDRRPRFVVLMTPTLSFWEWYLLGEVPADPIAYQREMAPFDLPPWLARSRAAGTLLQFGKRDEYVAAATAVVFRNALPDRDRTLATYDTEHALADPAATAARDEWLARRLGF